MSARGASTPAPAKKVGTAKALRRRRTNAEATLWRHLRRRQMGGAYFRRQHPIGPYVVDFYCAAAKLVVEIDGGRHAVDEAKDATRTAHLEARGCNVIRFWNVDVLQNIEGVLTMIEIALRERGAIPVRDTPPPPSQGGG